MHNNTKSLNVAIVLWEWLNIVFDVRCTERYQDLKDDA